MAGTTNGIIPTVMNATPTSPTIEINNVWVLNSPTGSVKFGLQNPIFPTGPNKRLINMTISKYNSTPIVILTNAIFHLGMKNAFEILLEITTRKTIVAMNEPLAVLLSIG